MPHTTCKKCYMQGDVLTVTYHLAAGLQHSFHLQLIQSAARNNGRACLNLLQHSVCLFGTAAACTGQLTVSMHNAVCSTPLVSISS